MSKKLLVALQLLLACFIALVLVACGSEEDSGESADDVEQPVAEQVATEEPAEPVEEPAEEPAVELFGDPIRGGLLYDKWWKLVGADAPESDHPLWATQSTNERSGGDTWRCKECHGWDYKGADGAYGDGSHFTGFTGILQWAGGDANEILATLTGSTNPDHDFSTVMDGQALTDLALFISEETVDMSLYTNADKTPVSSDAALGQDLFLDCADCHGTEGLAVNFGDTVTDPEYLSGLAQGNPWETMHKVRFGQPGTDMISAVDAGWSDEEIGALLAYLQTLPELPVVSSGGLLYDKWWKAAGVDEPAGDQPLWSTQNTNERSGTDTWRCKECHGWDYAGADGAYGSGSHMTGFAGVLGAGSMSPEELMSWLDGSTNADHDFSPFMDADTLQLLVAFLQEGVMDTSPYINADKSVNGDSAAGEGLYAQGCARCHGDDGTDISFGDASDPEYLGDIASGNPWEFLHKALNGQPGEPMTQGREMGWTIQELVDLLAYVQTFSSE